MADFASIYAKNYRDGTQYYDWATTDDGLKMTAGYKWSDSNWVMCIKFTLPTAAKSITLSFCNATGGITKNQAMRYKFTTSEDSSLVNATSNVAGEGTFTINPGDYVRTTVTIKKTMTAGTHYMYIWTDNSSVTYNVMNTRWFGNSDGNGFYGSYEELEGCVNIDNGVSIDAYECYIDNGSNWDKHTPYIDNGTSWDMCG